ncbi:hypothetical protein FRC08_015282 [Ceratobasidium sp. 394]|nr:hypothetical protein FRC08_015282 [Ceratobasidium sp. 394]
MADPGPSNLPRKPTAPPPSAPIEANVSSPASPIPTICTVCSNPSKYTCPRCSVKTCSLACSKSHKTSTGCTGERDKAAYVPMNTYTWGTLADDYVFLEDIGRNITGWGRDIVSTGKGRGGRRGGKGGRAALAPKCEALRVQLAARDIEISFVSEGMEKRRLSQSVWDVRTKTAYLTVEFVFHIKDPNQKDNNFVAVSLLTHRNDLTAPLATSLTSHLKRKSDVPASIFEFMKASQDLPQGPSAIPSGMLFAVSQLERLKPSAQAPAQYQAPALPIRIASQPAVSSTPFAQLYDSALKPQKVFYPIDPNTPLQNCLRHRSFVEWPTIDVFPSRQAFQEGRFGVLVESTTRPATLPGDSDSNKRRKTETGLVQLIGGYGEESEPEIEELERQETGVLGISGLGDYASDEGEEADSIDEGH